MNQTAIVTLYTMLWQPLFNGSMVVEENNVLAIDLSTQARGLYLIIIRTTDQVIHKKVVLQ